MVQEFQVPGMSCQHCVQAVTKEVMGVSGVQMVNVDLGTKQVKVETLAAVSTQQLVDAINEAGYDDVTVVS